MSAGPCAGVPRRCGADRRCDRHTVGHGNSARSGWRTPSRLAARLSAAGGVPLV